MPHCVSWCRCAGWPAWALLRCIAVACLAVTEQYISEGVLFQRMGLSHRDINFKNWYRVGHIVAQVRCCGEGGMGQGVARGTGLWICAGCRKGRYGGQSVGVAVIHVLLCSGPSESKATIPVPNLRRSQYLNRLLPPNIPPPPPTQMRSHMGACDKMQALQ